MEGRGGEQLNKDIPTILLADDSATVRDMVSCFLRQEGYEVVCAKDGVEVVEKAMEELPDIIVLDLVMPRMNGYQSCRLLKNEPLTADIPVIILTSQERASRQYWGMQAGADAYVTKDADISVLATAIKQLLHVSPFRRRAKKQDRPNVSIDVIAAANEMLDKRLFESTIINEIGRLSATLDDLGGTMRRVLHIMESLLDFSIGAIVLAGDRDDEEDKGLLALRIKADASDVMIAQVKDLINERMARGRALRLRLEDLDEICFEDIDRKKQGDGSAPRPLDIRIKPFRARGRAGGLVAVARRTPEFTDEDEHILNIVAMHSYTVLDNARLYGKVKRLSITDSLVRAYNRRYVEEHLEKELQRVKRYGGEFSVLIVDVDKFKGVNDRFGHQFGDSTLVALADLVKSLIRKVDMLGRYGGDEFIVLLPETGLKAAMAMAERIRDAAERQLGVEGSTSTSPITVSIGVSSYPDEGVETAAEVLGRADRALYLAKKTGRNRVCTHSDIAEVEER
jgi:two-component system cell cycle response regulator